MFVSQIVVLMKCMEDNFAVLDKKIQDLFFKLSPCEHIEDPILVGMKPGEQYRPTGPLVK